jgi:hypothetical protein
MITKTSTHTEFLFIEDSFEYIKTFENVLTDFAKIQDNVNLEIYLADLISHKKLIASLSIEKIVVNHKLHYENYSSIQFSPKMINLLHDLGAILEVMPQKNFEGETLYQVLDRMRERPAMYISSMSITALSNFIVGFLTACDGGTKETPSFDGFNDFIGTYYGKYTTAGWKNLILSNHYGNEEEALKWFFILLDEFREQSLKPDARKIIHHLLHTSFLDFSKENDYNRQKQVADLMLPISRELHGAIYMGLLDWYENLLDDIFEKVKGNKYLHNWLKANAPELVYFEYELWSGHSGISEITTLISSNNKQKGVVSENFEVLIETFFAINFDKANEVKEAFHAEQNLNNNNE